MGVTRDVATYSLTDDAHSLRLSHYGEPLLLTGTTALQRPIPATPEREPPQQPAGRAPRRRSPG